MFAVLSLCLPLYCVFVSSVIRTKHIPIETFLFGVWLDSQKSDSYWDGFWCTSIWFTKSRFFSRRISMCQGWFSKIDSNPDTFVSSLSHKKKRFLSILFFCVNRDSQKANSYWDVFRRSQGWLTKTESYRDTFVTTSLTSIYIPNEIPNLVTITTGSNSWLQLWPYRRSIGGVLGWNTTLAQNI